MNIRNSSAAVCYSLFFFLVLTPLSRAEEAPAVPDEIVLKDGSRVVGTVTGARDGAVNIDTDFAGSLSIEIEKIASVQTSNPVMIQLADKSVLSEQPLRIEEEMLLIDTATQPSQSYPTSELLVINPEPWELGQGYGWSGLASLAFSAERGNTDSDELDYSAESIWVSTLDRYTLRFNGENDKNNGEDTVKKWFAQGKYDYFLDGPYYVGMNALAEHDKFTDLDLRYVIGPYIGRQFYDEPILTFAGELGLSYVNEDFIVAEDNDYPAATWSLRASSNYLGGESRLYFENRGIWNLDETSDYVINTVFGLAFPLLWSLEAAGEILLDYDSGAVDDVDELDQTYRFRVGYTW